jgi:Ca-activated chloride channel family protein
MFRQLICVLGAVALFPSTLLAQEPTFRASVNLVPVTVTVTDRAGRYITNLDAKDFALFENGVSQDLALFDRERVSLALTLVVDSSASMTPHLDAAKSAAGALLDMLRPVDAGSIIEFNTSANTVQPFTRDVAALRASLASTTAGGTTALYDAVITAADQLHQLNSETPDTRRRSVIVVLSDGGDTSSTHMLDEVLARVRQSGAIVYAIRLRDVERPRRGVAACLDKYATKVLHQLTESTGGKAFFVSDSTELAGVYAGIGREVTSQYLLAYSPRASGERQTRRISVRVNRSDSVIRARDGYAANGGLE